MGGCFSHKTDPYASHPLLVDARAARSRGYLLDAEGLYEELLTLMQNQALKPKPRQETRELVHFEMGELCHEIAVNNNNAAFFNKAISEFQTSARFTGQIYGLDSCRLARPFNEIATIYTELGEDARAAQIWQHVLHLFKAQTGTLEEFGGATKEDKALETQIRMHLAELGGSGSPPIPELERIASESVSATSDSFTLEIDDGAGPRQPKPYGLGLGTGQPSRSRRRKALADDGLLVETPTIDSLTRKELLKHHRARLAKARRRDYSTHNDSPV